MNCDKNGATTASVFPEPVEAFSSRGKVPK